MQYLVSESWKPEKRGWPPGALRRLFHGSPDYLANQHFLSGVHLSTPRPQPSASCLVARAAGKPSSWPMGTQARSGVGVAPLTLLATLWSNVFQKSTCNQPVPVSAHFQRGQRSMTWILPGCMQHRHLHRWGHTANGGST